MGRLLGLAGAQTPELLDTKHKIEDVDRQTEVLQKDADTVECPESQGHRLSKLNRDRWRRSRRRSPRRDLHRRATRVQICIQLALRTVLFIAPMTRWWGRSWGWTNSLAQPVEGHPFLSMGRP